MKLKLIKMLFAALTIYELYLESYFPLVKVVALVFVVVILYYYRNERYISIELNVFIFNIFEFLKTLLNLY